MAAPQDIMEMSTYNEKGEIIQSNNKSWLRKQENERVEKIKVELEKKVKAELTKKKSEKDKKEVS